MKIIECPRDAMQGLHTIIPAEKKAKYINLLLKAGFDTIDFGSFVSARAIPQMQDTVEVLKKINLSSSNSKLLAIVANIKGAQNAVEHDEITYLGYPFSLSETFQLRNTNRNIATAFKDLQVIQDLAIKKNKQVVAYLSMGFGNPFNDIWNPELVMEWFEKLSGEDIQIISLADTIGSAKPSDIFKLFTQVLKNFPGVESGAHFHSTPSAWHEKIDAAFTAGCRRFDTAMKGYGGCPFAADKLTGNIATENLINYLEEKGTDTRIDKKVLNKAMQMAGEIFA